MAYNITKELLRSRGHVSFGCADVPEHRETDMGKVSLLLDAGGLLASIGALL